MQNELKFSDVVKYLWNWRDWEVCDDDPDYILHKYSKMMFYAKCLCVNLRERESYLKYPVIYDAGILEYAIIAPLAARIRTKLKTKVS